MIFETHAHYDDEQFNEDRDELLSHIQDQNVGTIVNVGASLRGCYDSVELARRYQHVYAAVGVHPDEVGSLNDITWNEMCRLYKEPKVVAVGEIGLDYYWDKESRENQKKWFIKQLDLARKLDLPIIIHSRESAKDTMDIMKEYAIGLKGVIHCYSYSVDMAMEYVNKGFYIGVGGVVTFKNARKLKEVVAEIPLERIVLETDSPYLAPVPYRGKRNDSRNIQFVAKEIAVIKNMNVDDVIAITEVNAKNMYGLSN